MSPKAIVIMILESMKMEIPVEAPAAGKLVELKVSAEDQVEEDQVVAVVEGLDRYSKSCLDFQSTADL